MGRRRLTDAQEQEMVALYNSGKNIPELKGQFNCGLTTVARAIRRQGGTLRRGGDSVRGNVADDFFDTLNPVSAYWIGFLMADGSISHNTPIIALSLQSRDAAHVQTFHKLMRAKRATRVHCRVHPAERSRITSKHAVQTLARYGVVPRKTFTAKAHGGVEHSRDFWRGEIDGDGCLDFHRGVPRVRVIGTFDLMTQFVDFCSATVDAKPKLRADEKMWIIELNGRKAKLLVEILYVGAPPEARLARKYETALKILEWEPVSHTERGNRLRRNNLLRKAPYIGELLLAEQQAFAE